MLQHNRFLSLEANFPFLFQFFIQKYKRMPSVAFCGTVESVTVDFAEQVSTTWGLLPGNAGWSLRNGESSGETQICASGETGVALLNHPIDALFETTTVEGWPLIVVEVWDKSTVGVKRFCGCGSAWLPPSRGQHVIDVQIWKPSATGLEALSDMLLPSVPDLKRLREIVVNPFMRSQVRAETIGTVRINLVTTTHGLDLVGAATGAAVAGGY